MIFYQVNCNPFNRDCYFVIKDDKFTRLNDMQKHFSSTMYYNFYFEPSAYLLPLFIAKFNNMAFKKKISVLMIRPICVQILWKYSLAKLNGGKSHGCKHKGFYPSSLLSPILTFISHPQK